MSAATPIRLETDEGLGQLFVPPHSIEAESSVLGGLLLENASWDRIQDTVAPKDFYRYEHRLIAEAVANLISSGKPADVITVFERLQSIGKAEEVGGLAYLNSLAQYVPSAGNIRRYAEIVRERAVMRRLAAAGDKITGLTRAPNGMPLSEMIDKAQAEVMALSDSVPSNRGRESMRSAAQRLLDDMQDALDGKRANGVMSGLVDLDAATGGHQPGDLVVIAARPSMGKTSLAIQFAEYAAYKQKRPTLFVSLEMANVALAARMVASIARVDSRKLTGDKEKVESLTDSDWSRVSEAMETFNNGSLDLIEDPSLGTISAIRSEARKMARENGGVGLVVVDYLQLMGSASGDSQSDENRAAQLGEITRGLKLLGKELGCPVIALSQLNRNVENRNDKRPMMSDIRESGAIEQDADVIMFVYRDEYYYKEASKDPGVAEIIIGKQRNGPTGTVRVAWNGPLTKFENLAYGA